MEQNTDSTDEVEWESEIEYNDDDDEYDRSARGKLVIDGPDGRLIVLKRYEAMVDESKGLMEPGKIREHAMYYRSGERDHFTDGYHDWQVDEDVLADEGAFVEDCREALEVDPQLEYEQYAEAL